MTVVLTDLFKLLSFFQVFKFIQREITQKRYKIELYLQWRINRKSYMIYRTGPFSMILNDPYPSFKVILLKDTGPSQIPFANFSYFIILFHYCKRTFLLVSFYLGF